jgi:hypothetical protein
MKYSFFTRRDAMRGGVAGAEAVASRAAAQAIFDAGGRKVLPGALQRAVRAAVERETSSLLTAGGLLESAAPSLAGASRAVDASAARVFAGHTLRAASRQVLRSVGAAAGAGALIDGGWALMHAVRRVRAGRMTRRDAVVHVAQEAGTGAAATAAGTAAAVTLMALTGGVAAPAAFLVGAATSMAAKAGLDAWFARGRGAIRAELGSREAAARPGATPSA